MTGRPGIFWCFPPAAALSSAAQASPGAGGQSWPGGIRGAINTTTVSELAAFQRWWPLGRWGRGDTAEWSRLHLWGLSSQGLT